MRTLITISLLLVALFVPGVSHAAKAYTIAKIVDGSPIWVEQGLEYRAYALRCRKGNWGLYAVSGTGAQLQAIDALADVYGISTFGNVDEVMDATLRTNLNQFIIDKDIHPTWQIPADWTARQVFRKMVEYFDLQCDRFPNYIIGPEDD
ncbi:MAG: hypothetical protein ACYS80_26675 [Planctomycetota bacterium]|jgi:hypothetical protein